MSDMNVELELEGVKYFIDTYRLALQDRDYSDYTSGLLGAVELVLLQKLNQQAL